MRYLILLLIWLYTPVVLVAQDTAISQKVFSATHISFGKDDLSSFYSSFCISGDRVFFLANDYKLYCLDKHTGATEWVFGARHKTNLPPYSSGQNVFVCQSVKDENKTVRLDARSGAVIQTLSIAQLRSQPCFRDSIMYTTTITDGGGQVLAYDFSTNSIAWKKFIAHGIDTRPYYHQNKMIVNAEVGNWVEMDYNGQLPDADCNNEAKTNNDITQSNCTKHFYFLTHDGQEIPGEFVEKNLGGNPGKIRYSDDQTFILTENKLLILGNNKKIKKDIAIENVIALKEHGPYDYAEILKIEHDSIWFVYQNTFAVYDFRKGKTLSAMDLSKWGIHQAMMNENNLWVISKSDGQLYGLKLN